MNFYNISQIPERIQTAQHFQSSLEEPTLNNIEAQLYATRQRNYELAMHYFQNKYGSSQVYNQYIENNNLQGLGAPREPIYDFKRELQKKALQIQQQEMQKINSRAKHSADNAGTAQYDSKNYKRTAGRKNIWSREEQPIEEHHEEPQNKQQAYEINIHSEHQNAFMSEFKNYLNNKKKLKQDSTIQPNNTSSSQFKESNLSMSPKKSGKAEEKCYEEELVKKMFRQITSRTDASAAVEKIQLVQYLNSNYKIIKVLGVTSQEVSTTIMAQECKDPNLMTISEALIWVYGCLGKTDVVKKLKADQEFQTVPQGCMLSKDLMQLFEDTFRGMDRHNDLIIKRSPFISRLTAQPLVKKNLNLPAVFEPSYNRHVSLRRIFQKIQIQTLLCSEQQKRLNEYISWNQFLSYFQSGHTARGKYDLIILVESLKNEDKFGMSHLPESISEIISSSMKKIDNGEEMFNTLQLINQIKLHKQYEIQKYTYVKKSSDDGETDSQTFEEILNRIKETGLKYVTPKEFLQYFSERGRPIQAIEAAKNQKMFSASKVTFVQNQMFPKGQQEPEGYDSDPELYNNSKLHELPPEGRKSQKEFKRFKQTSKSFFQPEKNTNNYENEGSDHALKITIPQPFSFQQREKERQMARSQQKSLQTVPQQTKFRAQPVPLKVKQIGLYEKMMIEQQKKNEDRKRSSMIMTLANERPFSFENRKITKKTKQERQEFIFKAKPIPWFCSVDLLARKKQEQIARKEKIAKTAQESLTKAKLPPRMEKDFLQREAKKAISPQNKGNRPQSVAKVRDPPDFTKLHKDFSQAMQRKRKENKPTEVKQFRFASTSKDNTSKLKQVHESQIQPIKKAKYQPHSTKSNIDVFAQSTAKFNQQVQKRRKEEEEKRRLAAKKQKEEEQRQKVDEELKRKVHEVVKKNKENKQEPKRGNPEEENKRQASDQQAKKQQIIQKARQQPTLMERISKRDEKIEKMKKLWEISQTLLKNGLKGKQHDHYFNREQLLLIDDYKQLKDKL